MKSFIMSTCTAELKLKGKEKELTGIVKVFNLWL